MKIAFLHYHLKPGGVTRVIQQQTGICVQMGWQYCILAGENPLNMPGVVIIPDLHYDLHRSGLSGDSALRLAEHIEAGIREFFPMTNSEHSPVDLIHVHNATLAKNSDLLPALHILRKRGNRLFLQLHDFAEDGRPSTYSATDYPANTHYGCINNRDRKYLSRSGLPEDRLHIIPNLVSPLPGAVPPEKSSENPETEKQTSSTGSDRFALYPVRGIRRKNLGELILLSVILENITFGITLEPNNPTDMPSYQFWESFASEKKTPVEFNVARKMGFEEALKRADFFISTSVQEGFGFAFLEPWTLKKIVAGRLIPYVNKDFVDAGMEMYCFYNAIPIPVSEIKMDLFRQCWLNECQQRLTRFSLTLRNQGLNAAAENIRNSIQGLETRFAELYTSGTEIDFARLDRENQANVIHRVISNPQLAENIRNSIPQFLTCPIASCTWDDTKTVEHNHQQVYTTYGEKQYSQRLKTIYEAVIKDPVEPDSSESGYLDKEILLQSFLDPAHVFLITSS